MSAKKPVALMGRLAVQLKLIDMNQVEGQVRASSVRKIAEIVENHPEEAVAIIRSWFYQES